MVGTVSGMVVIASQLPIVQCRDPITRDKRSFRPFGRLFARKQRPSRSVGLPFPIPTSGDLHVLGHFFAYNTFVSHVPHIFYI